MISTSIKTILFIGFSLVIFSSCTHYYYGPNSANVPVLEKKGDSRIAGASTISDESTGFEFQSAYAFTDHFGGMVNIYSTSNGKPTKPIDTDWGKATYLELGLGRILPVENENILNIFEIYAGAGSGTINNYFKQNGNTKVQVNKFFLQPSIGFNNKKRTLQLAVSMRLAYVMLHVKKDNLDPNIHSNDFLEIEQVKKSGNGFYVEPGLTLRSGTKNVKLQFQLTPSIDFGRKKYKTQGAVASFGIIYGFNILGSK